MKKLGISLKYVSIPALGQLSLWISNGKQQAISYIFNLSWTSKLHAAHKEEVLAD